MTVECQHCGAPWEPDLTGACRYCRTVAPPPGARPAWEAEELDATALYGRLQRLRSEGRLGAALHSALGDRARMSGGGVSLTVEDWTYEIEGGQASAVHAVRGVALKRETLEPDEWVAVVAAHLAEYSGKNAQVREGLLALEKGS